jgi:hypothetical protein
MKKEKDLENEGGYTVPNHIAIWFYRLSLLQLLANRSKLKRFYFFNNKGIYFYE